MKHFALAAALLAAPLPAAASTLGPFTDLLVFGDSLSDAGRAFSELDLSLLPPPLLYPEGQFTNGDTWAVQLGADTPLVNNFAFGGARATTNGDPVPDFAAQRQDFVDAGGVSTLGSRPLTAVFFGGNDLRDALGAPDPNALIAQALFDILTGTGELIAMGLTDVLVFGLPDLGRVPEVLAFGPAIAGQATQASIDFNAVLQAQIASLLLPSGVNVGYFDTFGAFEAIFADAEAQGFDLMTPCLSLFPDCGPDTAGNFVFYDPIHPTAGIHAAFARAVALQIAPVPLPAGGLLLLVAVGGLALVRRRAA